jgi:hypothetical protein
MYKDYSMWMDKRQCIGFLPEGSEDVWGCAGVGVGSFTGVERAPEGLENNAVISGYTNAALTYSMIAPQCEGPVRK